MTEATQGRGQWTSEKGNLRADLESGEEDVRAEPDNEHEYFNGIT